MKPTIVLVHGAYAESSSWNGLVDPLRAAGHRVIAFANPLRSVAADAEALSELVETLNEPVVLVGHSYGGAVMTNVGAERGEVIGLVYVAAFALQPGESAADASALAPGSTLGDAQVRVPTPGGGFDTYIDQAKYHHQFAADLPTDEAARMAVTQRPVTVAALSEPSGPASLWSTVASWFVFGELDRNIPVEAHRIMAERASARRTVEIPGASHVVGISHPEETGALIREAAEHEALSDA